jgi:DNA-binding CsgD family transcriptional regulator
MDAATTCATTTDSPTATDDDEFPSLVAFQPALDRLAAQRALEERRQKALQRLAHEAAERNAAEREERRRQGLIADCPLSDRELEVVSALAGGGGYKGAAERLGLSWRTVKSHMKRIYAKLEINDGKVGCPSALTVMICLRNEWITYLLPHEREYYEATEQKVEASSEVRSEDGGEGVQDPSGSLS